MSPLASLFILSLAPIVSSHVYSLDARGVDEVMQKGRATVIKFTTSEAGEDKSLNELWAQLDNDFRTSGLVFASVDCQQTPEACAARKIGVETALPIVKFWNPDPNVNAFRRYSGPNELNALRTYLAKKLAEMPESLVRAHVNTYEAEARAKEERKREHEERKRQRDDRQRKLFDPAETSATLYWVMHCFIGTTMLSIALTLYLWKPTVEPQADLIFVGSASTPAPSVCAVFLSEYPKSAAAAAAATKKKKKDGSGAAATSEWRLEPSVYARIGRNAMPPSPLNISIGRRRRIGATFILHHGTSTSAEVDGRTEDFSSIRTVCIDPTASGTPVMEVESKVLPYDVPPVIHVLCTLKRGRPRSGVRIDLLATAAADGSVRAVHVPTPIVLPPIEPGYFERFSRWIATTFLLPKPPVPPDEPIVIQPPRVTTASADGDADDEYDEMAPLEMACVPLSVPSEAKEGSNGGDGVPAKGGLYTTHSHLLVSDASSDTIRLHSLTMDDKSGEDFQPEFKCIGELKPQGSNGMARPCALAVYPQSHSIAYCLCAGEQTVLVLELTHTSAPKILQRLPLPGKYTKGGPDTKGGALISRADGKMLYALLPGGGTGAALSGIPGAVCVLAVQKEGKKLSLVNTIVLPEGTVPPGGGGAGWPPSLALAGKEEGVLLVAADGRLCAFGVEKGEMLASMPVESPCGLLAARWP